MVDDHCHANYEMFSLQSPSARLVHAFYMSATMTMITLGACLMVLVASSPDRSQLSMLHVSTCNIKSWEQSGDKARFWRIGETFQSFYLSDALMI